MSDETTTARTPNAWEQKVAARLDRLRAYAERKRAEGTALVERAHRMAEVIPFGQPILVGHYSERRDRRYRGRIEGKFRKGFETLAEARDIERRVAAAEANTAISSDDPNALDKLRAKLAEHERQHSVVLDVNKRLRKGATIGDVAPLLDWWEAPERRLQIIMSMGHRTIPVTNSSAETRRIKARIAELEARAVRAPREPQHFGSVTVEEGDNRVRLVFPGKPLAEVRSLLKSHGFRWSPTAEAWQRRASPGAWELAVTLAKQIGGAA